MSLIAKQENSFSEGLLQFKTGPRASDENSRPVVLPNTDPTPQGVRVCPDSSGATNWATPSYDPNTHLFYISVRETCSTYTSETHSPIPGASYTAGGDQIDAKMAVPDFIRALDPTTGALTWDFSLHTGYCASGVLGTGGGVLFAATKEGNLIALNARTGAGLWHYQTRGVIQSAPFLTRLMASNT